ncbi:hypothetical protein COX64_04590, partial [Candidatus Dojkabacteria bacterium CG_4_10_14_0_2_um_filter_Dojkabacteria_WS6_41_15]
KFEYKKRFGVKRLHCISVNKLKLDLGQGLLFLYIDWKGGIVHYRKVNSTEVSNIMSSDYVCFLQRQLLRLLKYNSNHLEAAMFLTLRYFGLKHNSPTALPNIYTLAKLIPEVTTSVEVKVKDYSNESYFDDVLDLTVFLKKYLYKDGKGDYNPVRIADIHGIKVGMRANAPEYLKWNGSVWESLGVDVDLFDAEVPKEFFCAE